MEKFKAVEKAMKTKAYSKEGLSAAAKLDPKEQAKSEVIDFLSEMIDELAQRIEALEAEAVSIQATMKKGKSSGPKADRIANIESIIERHKWHQSKLELIQRALENGAVEPEEVKGDLEENIRYYVTDGENADFMEDDTMYDDLNLEAEEDLFGVPQDGDKGSSQDAQSMQDDVAEPEARSASIPGAKTRTTADPPSSTVRRTSGQLKSPLPTLATLHTPSLPTISSGPSTGAPAMKPASVPTRPPGEGLKYASAAAAAAASDKNGVGIAPLPPPPGVQPAVGISSLSGTQSKASSTSSPSIASVQPAPPSSQPPEQRPVAPAAASSAPITTTSSSAVKSEPVKATMSRAAGKAPAAPAQTEAPRGKTWRHGSGRYNCANSSSPAPLANITSRATNGVKAVVHEPEEEESIYHLPASLQDLVESYETTKRKTATSFNSVQAQRMLAASRTTAPDPADSEPPRNYQPEKYCSIPASYPREPLTVFDEPALYQRVDPDTLFYAFYYKQGSSQQYLSAKALKEQSWRFHKQYQTWFQRHEEPKNITEEFEQGTYRFFDYESTWYVQDS